MRRGVAEAGKPIENAVRFAHEALRWIRRRFQPPRLYLDADWYSGRYPDARGVDPFRHYMRHGWRLGHWPNPFLDPLWYRLKYGCESNPLVDYIRRTGRNPHPLFDRNWYLRRYPDVAAHGLDALLHYLLFGRREHRRPHPLFDAEWYAARYADFGAQADPFLHYLEQGAAARLDPHPLFDARWYVENNPGLLATGQCALAHFVEEGALAGRSPHILFDADWYLRAYPDVSQARVNPLVHYLQCGASEQRDPHPHFQTRWYCGAWPEAMETNPLTHFVATAELGVKPNFLFDPAWYARRYGALIPEGQTAFEHFLRIGRFADLRPGPFFDPAAYRRSDPNAARSPDPTAELLNAARRDRDADPAESPRRFLSPARIAPVAPARLPAGARIAVHLHIWYPDIAAKLAAALVAMPLPFDLYVTIAGETDRSAVERLLSPLPKLDRLFVTITPNRGRDIAPFIVGLGATLAEYDFILHLHSKKSPHNSRLSGWLDYLLENLLGAPENVAGILDAFGKAPALGILYPEPYAPVRRFMRLGGNAAPVRDILARLGMRAEQLDPLMHASFPAGSMMWMRGAVMKSINRLALGWDDFPPEAGQDDGTLAHAIERLFPLFALRADLDAVPFIRGDGAFDDAGARTVSQREPCDVAILDHDLGGGANVFLDDFLPACLERGSVVRLYRDRPSGRLIYERIGKERTDFLVGPVGETMGQALRRCAPREVVVNSLHGADCEIGGVIAALTEMKKSGRIVLRLMAHDFHLACPSQHLLDRAQHYCGLPSVDSVACRRCVRDNENIAPGWRASFHLTGWRLQSQALLDLSDEIRFFDASGPEILRRALDVPAEACTLAPHVRRMKVRQANAGSGARLTIGVLGTLTYAKGVDVVNALADYIRREGRDSEIVLIGAARAAVDPALRVHGAYRAESLPDLAEAHGVNVVFICSVVPETFCFTLDEAMAMRLPVVAFDLGAQGNRLRRYDRGMVVPPEASIEEIHEALSLCRRRFAPAGKAV